MTHKAHWFEAIMIPVSLAIAFWIARSYIELKVDVNTLTKQVDNVSMQISKYETDSVTKDILELQIENIKEEIAHGDEISRINAEHQLLLIESEIELLNQRLQNVNTCETDS